METDKTMEKSLAKDRTRELEAFSRILDIMDELREKCPWDREQTLESLRPLTIEETFELSEAIMQNDLHNISKELGDILLHIIFYAKIGTEQGAFGIADVIDNLCNKLIYRHPHVFSATKVENAAQVIQNWEQLKTREKDGNKTVLSGVPDSLPSVIKAYRMQDKARAVGFDWEEKEQVWDKVREEMEELRAELDRMGQVTARGREQGMESRIKAGENSPQVQEYVRRKEESAEAAEKELGDVLFSLINAARLYELNPDSALEKTNKKFKSRFTYLENQTIRKGRSLSDMTLEEMDRIWDQAKALERQEAARTSGPAESGGKKADR